MKYDYFCFCDCEFRDTATMQRDIFIIRVANDRPFKWQLTFNAAVAKAEAVECACQDQGWVQVEDVAAVNVHQIKKHKATGKSMLVEQPSRACYRCGSTSHLVNSTACKVCDVICNHCGKKGHFSKVCKSVPSTLTFKSTACNTICDTDVDCFSIFAVGNSLQSFNINIDGETMQCIADTGTQLNIIPKSYIRHHSLQATSMELTAYGGNKLTVVGTCILLVAYKKYEHYYSFLW